MRAFYHLQSVCVEKCSGHDETRCVCSHLKMFSSLQPETHRDGSSSDTDSVWPVPKRPRDTAACIHPQDDVTCFLSVSFSKPQMSLDQRETSNC